MQQFQYHTLSECEIDFQLFRDAEGLGTEFNPLFQDIIYGYAKDAFQEGWSRGFKHQWTKEYAQYNERANERMRAAFAAIGQQVHSDALHDQNSIVAPRVNSTMNDGWYTGLFPHIYKSHMEIFGNVHSEQQADRQKLPVLIYKFYRGLMSMGWNAGWEKGQMNAEKQFSERVNSKFTSHLEETRSQASQMEQDNLLKNTQLLFRTNRDNLNQPPKVDNQAQYEHPDSHEDEISDEPRARERMTA